MLHRSLHLDDFSTHSFSSCVFLIDCHWKEAKKLGTKKVVSKDIESEHGDDFDKSSFSAEDDKTDQDDSKKMASKTKTKDDEIIIDDDDDEGAN